jgi:DNA-binding response OmpR family regulator/putative methionine-R-sulfoxide reductase with GAF domain
MPAGLRGFSQGRVSTGRAPVRAVSSGMGGLSSPRKLDVPWGDGRHRGAQGAAVGVGRLPVALGCLPCYSTNMPMNASRGRVLVVDDDPDVLDLLDRQVLQPLGYTVATADDSGSAIQHALNFVPDLIIASLTLPGLSGKDLLVALRSQGMELPMLVMAPEGMEADAIQAFRLGARDYLVKPVREAEVVTAVERALNEVRLRNERQQLAEQLAESNRELERRVRELTTLYGIGKAVTSTTHQDQLFSKLMESSLYVTEAGMGWVLLKEEKSDQLVLRAQRNLPPALSSKLHQPWDDGVSSLVMLSGEALNIYGEGLAQFKLARLGKAALIVPIKARNQAIGVICVARQDHRPFSERNQAMLEAVADYASISLVNARLFQALEARAQRLQRMVDQGGQAAEPGALDEVQRGLRQAQGALADLLADPRAADVIAELRGLGEMLDSLASTLPEGSPEPS